MTNTEANTADKTAVVAAQGAQDGPERASPKKGASQKKGAPKGQKTAKRKAKAAAPKKKAKAGKKAAQPKEATEARHGSKKAIVLDLLRRAKGATLAEIMTATGWQPHSVRGFISGALGKKMGLTVESAKNDAGARAYKLAK